MKKLAFKFNRFSPDECDLSLRPKEKTSVD
jgi:hypothetical protein